MRPIKEPFVSDPTKPALFEGDWGTAGVATSIESFDFAEPPSRVVDDLDDPPGKYVLRCDFLKVARAADALARENMILIARLAEVKKTWTEEDIRKDREIRGKVNAPERA